jgi:hypothetical protein
MERGLEPPQFGPGRTITSVSLVAVLPQSSKAVTWTGVVELRAKQKVGGGLYTIVGREVVQQGSVAMALIGTVVQLLQV